MSKKIILTSRGLNCEDGRVVIKRAIKKCIGENYKAFLTDKSLMICVIEEYGVNELLINEAVTLGFTRENIVLWDEHVSKEIKASTKTFDFCYVSEGNTFQIAQMLRLTGGDTVIKNSVTAGGFYIGASAGAILATSDFAFAADFDKNFVRLTDFEGLNLLPESLGRTTIIPHYDEAMFERWKSNTPEYRLEEYDYIDCISDRQYKLF